MATWRACEPRHGYRVKLWSQRGTEHGLLSWKEPWPHHWRLCLDTIEPLCRKKLISKGCSTQPFDITCDVMWIMVHCFNCVLLYTHKACMSNVCCMRNGASRCTTLYMTRIISCCRIMLHVRYSLVCMPIYLIFCITRHVSRTYGKFSKFQVCFCGLDPGNLKFETVRTHKQRICF